MKNSPFVLPVVLSGILAACCLFCPTARANDSAFSGVSGTPKPMSGEHRTIAMQSEKIVIVADAKGYSTDVDFVFRNDGGKTSVAMGFPENSYNDGPDGKGKSSFLRFATWVDGRKTPAKRVVIDGEAPEIEAYWVKTVDFAAHGTRRVRVSYRSPWGGNTMWGTRSALIYDFTGKNWKGLVERSDLEIRVAAPGLWIGLPLFDEKSLPMALDIASAGRVPGAAIFRKTWRNWQAQGTLTFGLTRAVPFWMLDRATLSNAMDTPTRLRNATTFRVGAVPEALPQGAENPPAFNRGGVTFISLSHLKDRLGDFADDLNKHRGVKVPVYLKWDAKTGVSTLIAGAQTLHFSPGASPDLESPATILLQGQYDDDTLYVPLASVAKKLGLTFQLDPKNRLFDLGRGHWSGAAGH